MAKGPPKKIRINHDSYHAKHVGRMRDGRQFFLTIPFVPAEEVGTPTGREFIALYVFDKTGQLQSATIDDLGPRVTLDEPARLARRDALLASLGPIRYQPIRIAPFRIEMFGVEFGLIPQPPEEPGEDWSVIAEPGNVMCFWPPWNTGDYDT
jgi:hypothetical protein